MSWLPDGVLVLGLLGHCRCVRPPLWGLPGWGALSPLQVCPWVTRSIQLSCSSLLSLSLSVFQPVCGGVRVFCLILVSESAFHSSRVPLVASCCDLGAASRGLSLLGPGGMLLLMPSALICGPAGDVLASGSDCPDYWGSVDSPQLPLLGCDGLSAQPSVCLSK